MLSSYCLFFFNDTATTEIYTLSLHDGSSDLLSPDTLAAAVEGVSAIVHLAALFRTADRKSTRLNSSHGSSSYAVFCLKKKMNSSARSSPGIPSTRCTSSIQST